MWRPGRTEHSALVVRLANGQELFFETVAEACRPDRFITAFLALDGVAMPPYPAMLVREIVGVLVRMAQVDRDRREDEEYVEAGSRYLRACLLGAGTVEVELNPSGDVGRQAMYRIVLRYAQLLSRIHGDPYDPPPPVLHATDRELLHVPRGLFLSFARRSIRGVSVAAFNAQMRRVGWEDVVLQPRKPGKPNAPRTCLRLWRIPDGWDGIHAEEATVSGCVEAGGYAEGRAPARARGLEAHPPASTPPRSFGRE